MIRARAKPRSHPSCLNHRATDGAVPPIDADGNYIIGPTHIPAFEMIVHDGVPRGTVHTFTMSSADSRIFPGIARDSGT